MSGKQYFMARFPKSPQAAERALADAGIYFYPTTGVPTGGTSGTGAGTLDFGSQIMDVLTGIWYQNTGTLASPIWTPISGSSILITAEVVLTSAQIKALRATPITIVPAAGAGNVIEFLGGAVFFKNGANVLTNPQNLALKLKDGTGVTVTGAITAAGFLDQAASEYQPLVDNAAGQIATKANSDNQPLVIHNTGASEITGNAANDATLLVKVAYRIWTVAW